MRFPVPLVGLRSSFFSSAIANGWGGEDDCVVVRLSLGGRPGLVAEGAGRPEVRDDGCAAGISASGIRDLLGGVHLAAMSEAMAFCEVLGVDTELVYDIVLYAAGAGKVFERYFRRMKEKSWVVRGMQEVEGIRDRLVSLAASFWMCTICVGGTS